MKDILTNSLIIGIIIISLSAYFNFINTSTQEKNQPKPPEVSITTDEELEAYLITVVACEMPALYHEEALKAQAIASRTYALYQRDVNKVELTKQDQCYLSESDMQEKWGSDYTKYYEIIKNAVTSTESLVMQKNNQLFKSFYFSTSNGYTEDSITVFKEGDLKSVESAWDKENKNYEVKSYFNYTDLVSLLGTFNEISVTSRSSTNHVEKVTIDDRELTGIEFRKLLNLRSTDFTINKVDDIYEITTHGYGHGVGMSQYGANMLAKEAKTYEEILKYYYGDLEITKY